MSKQLSVEESEIIKIKQEIYSLENSLNNSGVLSVFTETKKSAIVILAEKYERLYDLGASDIPTNQIANYLVKKFEKLKIQIHFSTIYDNLPSKYKTHQPNPSYEVDSEIPNENSSLLVNYEEENAPLIQVIEEFEDTLKKIKSKLKTIPFLKKKDSSGNYYLDQQEIKADIKDLRFANKAVNQIFDDRVTMPVHLQHLALRIFLEESSKYAANVYVSKIKEFGSFKKKENIENLKNLMSFKQFRKLLTGKVKELQDLYIPKNKDEAQEKGCYGMQCKNMQCKSWRVYYEPKYPNGKLICRCYQCGNMFKPITEMLPKEYPSITIDWQQSD